MPVPATDILVKDIIDQTLFGHLSIHETVCAFLWIHVERMQLLGNILLSIRLVRVNSYENTKLRNHSLIFTIHPHLFHFSLDQYSHTVY